MYSGVAPGELTERTPDGETDLRVRDGEPCGGATRESAR